MKLHEYYEYATLGIFSLFAIPVMCAWIIVCSPFALLGWILAKCGIDWRDPDNHVEA